MRLRRPRQGECGDEDALHLWQRPPLLLPKQSEHFVGRDGFPGACLANLVQAQHSVLCSGLGDRISFHGPEPVGVEHVPLQIARFSHLGFAQPLLNIPVAQEEMEARPSLMVGRGGTQASFIDDRSRVGRTGLAVIVVNGNGCPLRAHSSGSFMIGEPRIYSSSRPGPTSSFDAEGDDIGFLDGIFGTIRNSQYSGTNGSDGLILNFHAESDWFQYVIIG